MKKLLGIVVLGLLWCNVGVADYIVTGKITGMECGMFGIKCKIVNVDAVKKDGQLYQLRGSYEKVSEYNKSKKRCWIIDFNKDEQDNHTMDVFRRGPFFREH